MSWEIQGHVDIADAEQTVAGIPVTEEVSAEEQGQEVAIRAAIRSLLAAGAIGGPSVFVRAGGHATEGHLPEDGRAREFLTLTIEWAKDEEAHPGEAAAVEPEAVPAASAEVEPAAGDEEAAATSEEG